MVEEGKVQITIAGVFTLFEVEPFFVNCQFQTWHLQVTHASVKKMVTSTSLLQSS